MNCFTREPLKASYGKVEFLLIEATLIISQMYLFVNYRTRSEQSGYPTRFRYLLPMVRMKYMICSLNYLRVNHIRDYDENWLID
jgi:hypothetical protein